MDVKVNAILKKNSLSVTAGRIAILDLFFSQEGALSHGDIEKRTGEKFDRVTVYRTLQLFLNKGIIHTIPTTDNTILYAMCKQDCEEGHHHDDHIHFICVNCGNTICMDEVHVPKIKLPDGFQPTLVEMVVSGKCRDCK